jgi:spore germination protein KB
MKEKITNGMFIALIINMMYSKSIGVTQGSMAREVGNDIWITTLLSCFQALIVMLIVIWIIEQLPPEPEYKGKFKYGISSLKKIINILFFLFFLFAFGNILSSFVFQMKDYFLTEMPVWIFVLLGTLFGTILAFLGLEVISRTATLGVVCFCIINILILIGSIKDFDIRELQPVLSSGISKNIWASRYLNGDWAVPIMATFFIYPQINDKKSIRKASVVAVGFATGIILLWSILINGVISSELASHFILTCVQLSKSIELGDYFHRLEFITGFFGQISVIVQSAIILYCAANAAAKIYNLNNYKITIIPIAISFGIYGVWLFQDHKRAMDVIEHLWITISLWTAIIIPILYLLLGYIYKMCKKGTQ